MVGLGLFKLTSETEPRAKSRTKYKAAININRQLPLILNSNNNNKYHWFLIECIYAIWHHLARIFTEAG